jgi:acyl-CoA synthetase (AMP-forming)/AMP-acid ligase II
VNILESFLLHAKNQSTAPAMCAPGWSYNLVSYGRLRLFANNVAKHALSAGLNSGDVVAIAVKDPIFHMALILGLTRIGVVSLSVHSPTLPTEFKIDALLSDVSTTSMHVMRLLRVDGWLEGDGAEPESELDYDERSIARIILTSGTTGDQKGVALNHGIIWRRIQTYDFAFGNRFPTCSRIFVDVGLGTNSGYLWAIYVLARGGTVFVRGADPAETMQALSLYEVQGMVAAPAGMAEFLDYYERSPVFFCPFEVMLSVGSNLATSLSQRVRARMCTHVVHGYGATEGNPVAGGYVHQFAHIRGAVGYVTPGMTVQAVDDGGNVLKKGQEGHIRFRGDRCVGGYLGNAAGAETYFRDGWFYPGDIGTITQDGVLIISGRSKNIIDRGGDKINPEAIEGVLLAYPGVVHAVAFGRANHLGIEEIWAVVEATSQIEQAVLIAFCGQRLGQNELPARILSIPKMPRNVGDKIDRQKVKAFAESTAC